MITSLLSKSTELWLEITTEVQLKSWESSQAYPSDFTRWRAHLNQLSCETFLNYLLLEQDFQATPWPSQEASAKIWELFNGTAISLGQKRLVLLPTEIVDEDEFRVHQEWVDVPKLVGDYYLAVQVNVDEQTLKIWGYTTHRDLKTKASYDVKDRTYSLDGSHLIKNLSVLWLSYELCPQETTQETVSFSPTLTATQRENLVKRLANTEIIEPRLEVPFSMWGSLVELDNNFNELCDLRLGIEVKKPINLAGWMENIFEAGWQSLESVFKNANLSASHRRSNNQGTIKRAKYIQINPTQGVVLQLELTPEENNTTDLVVKLTPPSGVRYLPSNINLRLISSAGEVIYNAQADGQVNFIKKEISFATGECFTIEISLDDFNDKEDFIV